LGSIFIHVYPAEAYTVNYSTVKESSVYRVPVEGSRFSPLRRRIGSMEGIIFSAMLVGGGGAAMSDVHGEGRRSSFSSALIADDGNGTAATHSRAGRDYPHH
jgi:hypothetical protein